jgi:hypothetical protein
LWFFRFAVAVIRRRPYQFTIRSLLVLAAVIALLAVIGTRWFHAVLEVVDMPRMHSCNRRLDAIQRALQAYCEDHGHFPPAYIADENGRPMHSWRVLITPYLGFENDLYSAYRFDEPWNGPNNRKLAQEIPWIFRCPRRSSGRGSLSTDYVVVVGPGTLFPGAETVSPGDIADGSENTITIVEIEDSDIHWMEPRDLRFEELSFSANGKGRRSISSPHPAGVAVGFADGGRSRIRPATPPETWRALLTRSGGEDVARAGVEAR